MTEAGAAIRNLGPKSRAWLAEIGVTTEAELRALGAVEAYARLRFRFGRQITRNMLFAMAAGLAGIDWRNLSAEHKAELGRGLINGIEMAAEKARRCKEGLAERAQSPVESVDDAA